MVIQQGAMLLLADRQGLIMFFRGAMLNRFTEIIIRFTNSGTLNMINVSAVASYWGLAEVIVTRFCLLNQY